LARCVIVRVAAIRPQLKHKPTWGAAYIVNVRLRPRHASLVGCGPRIGSLAMLAAMRRAQPLARRSNLR